MMRAFVVGGLVLLGLSVALLRAAPAPKTRGGYPTDAGNAIRFFAVALAANPDWSNRFLQLADIAIASGLTLRYSYTSGDYSGETFGCARHDCRTPWGFALVPRASVP
jgi:hypothetical protein